MSSTNWPGAMTVNVVNLTGSTITNLTASHTWKGSTTSGTATSLGGSGVVAFTVECGPGSNDDWTVTFDIGGTNYYRNGKQCNIEQKDATSGQAITINLLPPSTGWSIMMPVSSSCTDNSYDSQSAAVAAAEAGRSEPAGVGATA